MCIFIFLILMVPITEFLCIPVQAEAEKTVGSDTRIVIFKDRQVLEFQTKGQGTKTYRVCLGVNPVGPKRKTGDKKTPEGDYFISYKTVASRFHRFLGISYPGIEDARRAFETGLISLNDRNSIIDSLEKGKNPPWYTKLGGWVGIHGYPSEDYRNRWALLLFPKPHNWTDGCIAMWNFEIEELFPKVSIGTPVSIVP